MWFVFFTLTLINLLHLSQAQLFTPHSFFFFKFSFSFKILFPLHLLFYMPATNVVFILAARLTEQILQYIGLHLQLTENCNYFTNVFHKVTVNINYNQQQTCSSLWSSDTKMNSMVVTSPPERNCSA